MPIDVEQLAHNLPHGDETAAGEERGWFSHWRRGVGPTLRGWANGSRGAIIHMLASCAERFEVVEARARAVARMATAQAGVVARMATARAEG